MPREDGFEGASVGGGPAAGETLEMVRPPEAASGAASGAASETASEAASEPPCGATGDESADRPTAGDAGGTGGDEAPAGAVRHRPVRRGDGRAGHGRVRPAVAVAVSLAVALAVAYAAGVAWWGRHLYPGTTIDGVDVGGMDEAAAAAASDASGWHVTVIGPDGVPEELDAEAAGVSVSGRDAASALASQDPLAWPVMVLVGGDGSDREASVDEEALARGVRGLEMTDPARRNPPRDASVRRDGASGLWVAVPDEPGDLVDADALAAAVAAAVRESGHASPTVRVTPDMLVRPHVTANDPSLSAAVADANRWSQASVTFDIDGIASAETLDSDTVAGWVGVERRDDGTFAATLDGQALAAWVASVGRRYDTQGKPLTITTPWGKVAQVPGTESGTGRVTDEAAARELLEADIRAGEATHREFPLKRAQGTTTGRDVWGDDYIEIDRGAQHLWLVRDGVAVDGFPVITGKDGYDTPLGVSRVYGKVRDVTLISPWKDPKTGEPTYRTPIEVGIVISGDGGILIHDAPWQPGWAFGDASYRPRGGSHGCVNAREPDVRRLFGEASQGMPVVTHG